MAVCISHIFGVLPLSMMSCSLPISGRLRRQANMSSRCHRTSAECPADYARADACRDAALASQGCLTGACAIRRGDPAMQIQRLENQLRQLTGQNEELQHQNQLLQDALADASRAARQRGARRAACGGSAERGGASSAAAVIQRQSCLSAAAAASAGQRPAADTAPAPIVQAPGGRPSRRRLRSQPKSQCPRRPARARRRPDAGRGAGRRTRRTRGAGEPLNIESTNHSRRRCRRRRRRPAPASA